MEQGKDTMREEPTLKEEIERLGPWFHNLRIGGIQTAPDHFLGDFPRVFFEQFAHALPQDLGGKTVLDIGCNGGFYLLEMKRRGASRVLGLEPDPRYRAQAELAIGESGLKDIEVRDGTVYDVGGLDGPFDVVLFLGVLYHLRHPLLALDLLRDHAVKETLVFQCMQRGSTEIVGVPEDQPFDAEDLLRQPGYPRMAFVEHRYAGDPTNWWIPNRAGMEAMLRSAGFHIAAHPDGEVYVCTPGPRPWGTERLRVQSLSQEAAP